MPLYEYKCDACGHRFEQIQKFSDALESVCPKCGGVVRKLVSSPAIQFKGSGFYITDYGKKDLPGGMTSEGKSSDVARSDDAKAEKAEKAEKTEKTEKSDKTEKADKTDKAEKPAKTEKPSPSLPEP